MTKRAAVINLVHTGAGAGINNQTHILLTDPGRAPQGSAINTRTTLNYNLRNVLLKYRQSKKGKVHLPWDMAQDMTIFTTKRGKAKVNPHVPA